MLRFRAKKQEKNDDDMQKQQQQQYVRLAEIFFRSNSFTSVHSHTSRLFIDNFPL